MSDWSETAAVEQSTITEEKTVNVLMLSVYWEKLHNQSRLFRQALPAQWLACLDGSCHQKVQHCSLHPHSSHCSERLDSKGCEMARLTHS